MTLTSSTAQPTALECLKALEYATVYGPLLDAMTHTMVPRFDRIIANRNQSRTLATLRDTLLPKLLSGEVSVAEASFTTGNNL